MMAEPRTARSRTERPLVTRPLTDAEQARRYRKGITSRANNGQPVWAEAIPNGLPFKPYVYRGLGYDQIDGHPPAYHKGCRCATCRELHRQRLTRIRAELAARPRDEVPHGEGGYLNWGCRCGICTRANTEKCRQNRQAVAS